MSATAGAVAGILVAEEITKRLMDGLTGLIEINTKMQMLNQLLATAHSEGRTLTQADWDKLDADLADSKAYAQQAAQAMFASMAKPTDTGGTTGA